MNYGNDVRREWFERVFWDAHDRSHSAFQAFVDCCSASSEDDAARRDWQAFKAGWNAAHVRGKL